VQVPDDLLVGRQQLVRIGHPTRRAQAAASAGIPGLMS
jgi:hypothetical protein